MATVDYFSEISPEQASELRAGARPRGLYKEVAQAFIDSGSPGVQVSLENGPLSGKTAASVKASFANAINKDGNGFKDKVAVRVDDDKVYLLRTDM